MTRAHRLKALASHPATRPDVAARISASVRRHERRNRMAALAAHPSTNAAVSSRICKALGHDEVCEPLPAPLTESVQAEQAYLLNAYQCLEAMQARAERARDRSMTLLDDLAQATRPGGQDDWDEVAPGVTPSRSVRVTGEPPLILSVDKDGDGAAALGAAVAAEVAALTRAVQHLTVVHRDPLLELLRA